MNDAVKVLTVRSTAFEAAETSGGSAATEQGMYICNNTVQTNNKKLCEKVHHTLFINFVG